jgi:hypothetical protein
MVSALRTRYHAWGTAWLTVAASILHSQVVRYPDRYRAGVGYLVDRGM